MRLKGYYYDFVQSAVYSATMSSDKDQLIRETSDTVLRAASLHQTPQPTSWYSSWSVSLCLDFDRTGGHNISGPNHAFACKFVQLRKNFSVCSDYSLIKSATATPNYSSAKGKQTEPYSIYLIIKCLINLKVHIDHVKYIGF